MSTLCLHLPQNKCISLLHFNNTASQLILRLYLTDRWSFFFTFGASPLWLTLTVHNPINGLVLQLEYWTINGIWVVVGVMDTTDYSKHYDKAHCLSLVWWLLDSWKGLEDLLTFNHLTTVHHKPLNTFLQNTQLLLHHAIFSGPNLYCHNIALYCSTLIYPVLYFPLQQTTHSVF